MGPIYLFERFSFRTNAVAIKKRYEKSGIKIAHYGKILMGTWNDTNSNKIKYSDKIEIVIRTRISHSS